MPSSPAHSCMGRRLMLRVATQIATFLRPLDSMLRNTTPWFFTTDSESGKIVFCTDSHPPSALCYSISIVAFIKRHFLFFAYYNAIILEVQALFLNYMSDYLTSVPDKSHFFFLQPPLSLPVDSD